MTTSRQPNGASSIYLGKDGRWHGYVTVGVKDDGTPDRRHVGRKTRAEVTKAVRELEKQRDSTRRPQGRPDLDGQDLADPLGREHRSAQRRREHHRRLPRGGLPPPHTRPGRAPPGQAGARAPGASSTRRCRTNGSAAGTAHQAHRTVKTALNEAVRRRHLTINPASVAKAPKVEEEEVEPYTVEEVQRLLAEATKVRNTARWVIALALGLRQGEVLGLKWDGRRLRRGRALRPPWPTAAPLRARLRRQVRTQARLLPAEDQHPARDEGHQVPRWQASDRCARATAEAAAPAQGRSRSANVCSPATCGWRRGTSSPRRPASRSTPTPTSTGGRTC